MIIKICTKFTLKWWFPWSKNVLKVNIIPADIYTAHRLNVRKNAKKCKYVIVKFCRRNIKTDILTACRGELSVKPENFIINEFLTPQRQMITLGKPGQHAQPLKFSKNLNFIAIEDIKSVICVV